MRKVVHDTEIYQNLLLYVFYDIDTKEWFVFQISPYTDQRRELMIFIKTVGLMIGFNSLNFDYPLFHYLIQILQKDFNIKGRELLRLINIKSLALIKSNKFAEVRNPLISQLDPFKIHHFDNINKATSLKMLEFIFRMPNIAELPYSPNTFLTEDQVDKVIEYCKNDVFATNIFYEKSQQEIKMREKLSLVFNLPMMNWNDPKIGENILMKFIREKLQKYDLGKSPREKIVVKDILFDYLWFDSPPFHAIHQWFQGRVLKDTKKAFSELPLEDVQLLNPYINLEKKNMVKGKVKILNVVFNGFQYNFGLGGIHGSIESGVYLSDDEFVILDVDVAGFYPNEAIKNRFYPEHLTEIFCDILELIGLERKKYEKKTPENTGLKLAGNAAYGKSNSQFSLLYDPQYTMKTTINGQLLLCMLAEWLSVIPEIVMIQANTDGFTFKLRKSYVGLMKVICQRWENLTKLTLEHSSYAKMIIRDVNNYLAVDFKGKIKRKGAFEYERELHKNHSMLIIPKAIEQYYVNNIPIAESIMKGDKWDFFKRVKLNNLGRLVGRSEKEENKYHKITRYYISEYGETLIKLLAPLKNKTIDREFNIEKGFICTVANTVNDQVLNTMEQNINYQYYISECEKIINAINEHQIIEEDE